MADKEKNQAQQPDDQQEVKLTVGQFKELIKELRAPSVFEQRKLDKEEAEEKSRLLERKENAQETIQGIEKRKAYRQICSHKRRNGTSRAVHIANGDFFICQECSIVVFKEPAPPQNKRVPEAFYDTNLYNEFMQTARLTDL